VVIEGMMTGTQGVFVLFELLTVVVVVVAVAAVEEGS